MYRSVYWWIVADDWVEPTASFKVETLEEIETEVI
jgi:hypothetical protein